jgi:DnaJ-domain-containing protein 1
LETGRYLYGIIQTESSKRFGNIGLGNCEVYTIQYGDIWAVVSDIPVDYTIQIDEALIHEKMLRKIMETHTVIPMGFGVIARNESEIINILKQGQMKFKNTLKRIENKLQINVKISWDNTILTDILKESAEIQTLAAKMKKTAEQSVKIELGKTVKAALDERKNEYLKNISSILEVLSAGLKENKITDQDTIMSASFLVDKEKTQEFYGKLEELEKKYAQKLRFLCLGPLPPYNFTEIEIKKIDFKTVDDARKTLGLGLDVSVSEINSAYGQLARKYHPDLHPDDHLAEEKFKKIRNAHEVLTTYCEHYLCSLEKTKTEETFVIQEKTS